MIQKIDFYWTYEIGNFSLYCFSLEELIKQLKNIYGITLFNDNYNLN